MWLHVDGAYGGFSAAVPQTHDDLRGLSLADSVAVDPHKWLYAPLEAGCALVRNPEMLRAAFAYHPPYCKRLTTTPVRQARSVLKCPNDRKNRVVSAQATYPCGSSAVGGRVCEERYAAE